MSNRYRWTKQDSKDFDYVTAGISGLIIITAIITFFSRPSISLIGGKLIITQGLIIPSLIIGTMIWSVFEIFTKASRKAYDIIIKVIIAFPIGLLIGGFIGYESNFGQLIVTPAYNGNIYALFDLISIFIFLVVLVATNVYYHHCTPIRRR